MTVKMLRYVEDKILMNMINSLCFNKRWLSWYESHAKDLGPGLVGTIFKIVYKLDV